MPAAFYDRPVDPARLPAFAAGAVLTGGASRRMGTDEALVEVGGRPLAPPAFAAPWPRRFSTAGPSC